jgi:hypothetical protein
MRNIAKAELESRNRKLLHTLSILIESRSNIRRSIVQIFDRAANKSWSDGLAALQHSTNPRPDKINNQSRNAFSKY